MYNLFSFVLEIKLFFALGMTVFFFRNADEQLEIEEDEGIILFFVTSDNNDDDDELATTFQDNHEGHKTELNNRSNYAA